MSILTESIKVDLFEHAKREQPRECCGVVIRGSDGISRYVPCRNDELGQGNIEINYKDLASAEDQGELIAIGHSHPFGQPNPSQKDLVECERSGVPWIIINYPLGLTYEFEPSGYKAPLIGREFSEGVLDCYSLVQDYYDQVLSIQLPSFPRPSGWQNDPSYRPFEDNYEKLGFFRLDTFRNLREHDVILMQCLAKNKVDHCGVYLGNQILLHHQIRRQSAREVFGGWYLKCATMYLRHKSL